MRDTTQNIWSIRCVIHLTINKNIYFWYIFFGGLISLNYIQYEILPVVVSLLFCGEFLLFPPLRSSSLSHRCYKNNSKVYRMVRTIEKTDIPMIPSPSKFLPPVPPNHRMVLLATSELSRKLIIQSGIRIRLYNASCSGMVNSVGAY